MFYLYRYFIKATKREIVVFLCKFSCNSDIILYLLRQHDKVVLATIGRLNE